MFCLDAFAGEPEVFRIRFETDEVSFFQDCRDGRGAGTDGIVEHGVSFIGIGPDEVPYEVNRFLCLVYRRKGLVDSYLEYE